MTKFLGVNHLALITNDMDQTVRFYRDILGFPLVGTIGNPQFRHYFFDMGNGGTIAFFEWPGVQNIGTRKPAGLPDEGRQFDHVSFGVESLEAMVALQKRLRAAGVEVTRVVDHDFIQSIYFDDPNGIALEVSYWVRNLSEQPAWGDPEPVPAAREQMAAQGVLKAQTPSQTGY